ncbi:LamG-like jellyroll fold domain-containing protein [Bacillus sp. SCS-151]|uniref:LamG-like jellyroll fold domain-containing protein n=1 Tax=Nanhaiella sioensis TaxID=3115293 RepID=UPI00397D153D
MIITDGLIAYYHYQEGFEGTTWKNIAPSTIGQFDGVVDGAIWTDDGIFFDAQKDICLISDMQNLLNFTIEVDFDPLTADKSGRIFHTFSSDEYYYFGKSNGKYVTRAQRIDTYGDWDILRSIPDVPAKFVLSFNNDNNKGLTIYRFLNGGTWSTYKENIPAEIFQGFAIGKHPDYSFYDYDGTISYLRIYNRPLSEEEVLQNNLVGKDIGLEVSVPEAPKVVNFQLDKQKISDENGQDISQVTFQFDVDVTEWRINVLGTSQDTGTIAADGGNVSSNTEITAEIDYTELYQEGQNRINIYGKDADGNWTEYED